jgi:hypothetical protein
MSEHLYAATAGSTAGPGSGTVPPTGDEAARDGGPAGGKPDDVIDVEFEEKK